MLQLTFHALLPCPSFAASARDSYVALRQRDDARLRDACLSITLTDLGPSARTRYRLLFECTGTSDSTIRVVTKAADMHAALRSGFAVMLSSCAGPANRAQAERADISAPAQSRFAEAVSW